MKFGMAFLCAVLAQGAAAQVARPVLGCTLAGGVRAVLLARAHGLGGQSLFLRLGAEEAPAFSDMPDTDFVGQLVLARCVGKTLVFALDYGSPYLKGVALRQNPRTGKIEKLFFSEKSLPERLDLRATEMRLVFGNVGYETDKPYLIYRYRAASGPDVSAQPADERPAREGFVTRSLR